MTEAQLFGECGKCQRSLLGVGVDHDNELALLRLTKGLMVNHFYCVLILLLQKAIGFQDYTIKKQVMNVVMCWKALAFFICHLKELFRV